MSAARRTDDSPFLICQEVAARYRTSPGTVRYWASTGKGPRSVRVGKRRLYRLDDLLAWEAQLVEEVS